MSKVVEITKTNETFEFGSKVYSEQFGKGVVVKSDEDNQRYYPIEALFQEDNRRESFTKEGLFSYSKERSCYDIELKNW